MKELQPPPDLLENLPVHTQDEVDKVVTGARFRFGDNDIESEGWGNPPKFVIRRPSLDQERVVVRKVRGK